MHYLGVDHHKKSSYVTVIDERGKVVEEAQIANSPEALAAFLDGAAAGAVESAGTAGGRDQVGCSLARRCSADRRLWRAKSDSPLLYRHRSPAFRRGLGHGGQVGSLAVI